MIEINKILYEAKQIFRENNIDEFGKLLHKSWIVKRNLSSKVSNNKIDELYEYAINSGSDGGKLLGAGGGGFFVFYVRKSNQKKFFKKMKKTLIIPFNFEDTGSQIIVNTQNDEK